MSITRRAALAATAMLISGASYAQTAEVVTGAGATFPAPLYFRWADEFRKATGLQVNYQSIGSGAGINQIRNRTVDFGATDSPLQDPGDLLQIGTVEGMVVAAYNIPGIATLNLSMEIATKIYRGEITSWDHASIVALTPGLRLPRLAIVPIYRADGSGTTSIWTRGMRDMAPAGLWSDVGTSVRWPAGQGARGNEGVAATVQRVRGAIGYVEHIYAKANNLSVARMDSPRGRTYLLIPRNPTDRAKHATVVRFVEWCFSPAGQDIARDMGYELLPAAELSSFLAALKAL